MFDIKELCTIPPPHGGISVFVKRLVDYLSKEGYSVGALYSSQFRDSSIIDSPLFDLLDWEHSSNPISKVFHHIVRFFSFLNISRKYTIIHSHSGIDNMFTMWSIRHLCKKNIIITLHNSMVESYYKSMNVISKLCFKSLALDDVSWIAVSEMGKRQLLNLSVKFRNEIQVIPAYIPDINDRPFTIPVAMSAYIDSHDKNIVFYGHSFMTYNGEDIYGFVPALELFSNISKRSNNIGLIICLAEDQDQNKINELLKIARNYKILETVFWQIGPIDSMNSIWESCDVYIRPTNTDGDSVAVREALDYGVQVVASDVCERPQGVIFYKYKDSLDFLVKTEMALTMEKRQCSSNMAYYQRMKEIYDSYLKQK